MYVVNVFSYSFVNLFITNKYTKNKSFLILLVHIDNHAKTTPSSSSKKSKEILNLSVVSLTLERGITFYRAHN